MLRDPGLQQRQVHEVAAVERQFGYLLFVHEPTQRPGGRVDQRGFLGHDHSLLHGSGLERKIHHCLLGNRQSQTAAHFGPEAGLFCPHFIGAYREGRESIRAILGTEGGASQACFQVLCRDANTRNNRAVGILDRTENRAGGQLGHRQPLHC